MFAAAEVRKRLASAYMQPAVAASYITERMLERGWRSL